MMATLMAITISVRMSMTMSIPDLDDGRNLATDRSSIVWPFRAQRPASNSTAVLYSELTRCDLAE
jgi:hypothetical protein